MTEITIDTYREAEETLKRTDLRQALYDEGEMLMKRVLVNLHGEEHRKRKRIVTRILRQDFYHFYERTVFRETLAQTLAPFLEAGRTDLVDFGYRVMLNLTADFAGVDRPLRSHEETGRLLAQLRAFGKAATLGQSLGDREATRAEVREALADFDTGFFTPSLRRREHLMAAHERGEIPEAELPRDILVLLLASDDDVAAVHETLMKEMAFFLMAGAHTSIHTLVHAAHELLEWLRVHPEDGERVRTDPFFLQRCVLESVRLHPASPTAVRRPTGPVELPGRGALGEEDRVVIDLYTANRDTREFGADAGAYNPHRSSARFGAAAGLSFGVGMHACIGRNLAAGAEPRAGTTPEDHHNGTITLILRALLEHRMRLDPDDPPRRDTLTVRETWASYPVLLDR